MSELDEIEQGIGISAKLFLPIVAVVAIVTILGNLPYVFFATLTAACIIIALVVFLFVATR